MNVPSLPWIRQRSGIVITVRIRSTPGSTTVEYFQHSRIQVCSNHWRIQDFSEVGRQPSRTGDTTHDFAKFFQKLHEIERIWTRGGVPRTPLRFLDPPLQTKMFFLMFVLSSWIFFFRFEKKNSSFIACLN